MAEFWQFDKNSVWSNRYCFWIDWKPLKSICWKSSYCWKSAKISLKSIHEKVNQTLPSKVIHFERKIEKVDNVLSVTVCRALMGVSLWKTGEPPPHFCTVRERWWLPEEKSAFIHIPVVHPICSTSTPSEDDEPTDYEPARPLREGTLKLFDRIQLQMVAQGAH